jgi:hypothetical protein
MYGPTKLPNILVLALVFSVGEAAAQQEYRGTEQQQTACTPDVFRLCWSEIPNVTQIVACLVREKPRLSEGCRAVFEPPRQASHVRHRLRRHPATEAEK